ncbi:hypothetical protein ACH4PU_35360 [Streptomyces sp. NPDC021100]|uniref:hypothetical protein n=1 Tax=Streptomyces sp. NPDC021100 TaxID=3365114 RepID=UPI0037AB38CB
MEPAGLVVVGDDGPGRRDESWLEGAGDAAGLRPGGGGGLLPAVLWLFWPAANGRPASHVPDYFARREDGTGVVVDGRPAERRRPWDVAKSGATEGGLRRGGSFGCWVPRTRWWSATCGGWRATRHPRHRAEAAAARLLVVFAEPLALMDGAAAVGEPLAVLPVLFHLLWSHELMPLHLGSLVCPGVSR